MLTHGDQILLEQNDQIVYHFAIYVNLQEMSCLA